MRADGGAWPRLRATFSQPVSPLRGVAILVCTAVAGTALLGVLSRPTTTRPGPAGHAPVEVAAEPVVVHVAGLVQKPGLYRLAGGARVADAITAAGGPAEGADLSALNLARILEDGEQLLVAAPAPPGEVGRERADGKVDLNRADAARLDALPGIGPVLAARIVAYREQHGGFRSVRDLRRVQGIGEKLYQSLADLVAV